MPWNVGLPNAEYYSHDDPRLEQIIREVADQKEIALDTETTGLTVWKDVPLFWSLAWGDHRRVCLPASALPHFQREVFNDDTKEWVFANAKYDCHILANVGVKLAGKLVDTQVMHALLYEESPHSLDFMGQHILKWQWKDMFEDWDRRRMPNVGEFIQHLFDTDPTKLIEYASNDAYGTLRIKHALEKELKDARIFSLYPEYYATLWDLFYKTEVPFTKVLFKCERNGILLDKDYLSSVGTKVKEELGSIERELFKVVGRAINPNSPKQMREYFFDELKLQPLAWSDGGKTGVKQPKTDYDFLFQYAPTCKAAELMLKQRDLSKLIGTYVEGLPGFCDNFGRIHPRFNQDVARTGRLSSADPNCFHPDTELLTETGWKKIQELQPGEKVAQWDTDGSLQWEAPTAYHSYDFDGELVHVTGRVQALVTPDHRMVVRAGTKEWRMVLAENLGKHEVPIAGVLPGEVRPSASILQLVVAIQADGDVSIRKDGSWHVDFGFKKERKVQRLQQILQRLGVAFNHTIIKGQIHKISLIAPPSTQHYLTGDKNFVLQSLLQIDVHSRRLFLKELEYWDGSRHQKGKITHYWTCNKKNAEVVLTVASVSGVKASFGDYHPSFCSSFNANRRYCISFLEGEAVYNLNPKKVSRAKYTGKVWCVSVPSEKLLTRLNSRIVVSYNCQNIPNAEADKWKVRRAFISKAKHDLICCDYSALEMRLLACASREKDMIDIFLRGWDIHMGNASLVFGLPYDDIKAAKKKPKDQQTDYDHKCLKARGDVKSIGFGLNYGMKEKLLARNLKCTVEEAIQLMEAYMARYPAVKQFYAEAIEESRKTGYAFSVLGRRRFLPEIDSPNEYDRFRAERQAVNMQIQGSAADVAKMAMILIDDAQLDKRFGCDMLMQVHDELVFECPEETSDEALEEIKMWMEHSLHTDLDVPLTVEGQKAKDWASAK